MSTTASSSQLSSAPHLLKSARTALRSEGLLPLWDEARKWYSFEAKNRLYHNYKHAQDVVYGVMLAHVTCSPGAALVLAALWHDAVYIPGVPGSVNEWASAQALKNAYKRLCITGKIEKSAERYDLVERASTLVVGTAVANHLSILDYTTGREEQSILLDSDLSSLAAPYSEFVTNQSHIIVEQLGDPGLLKNRRLSAVWLKQLLDVRKYIYRTGYGRNNWEQKARANIEQWVLDNPQPEV